METPSFFLQNISITDNTYYKMGGVARYFAKPATLSEVQKTLEWCQRHRVLCAVLGSGSNSVYADGEFAGLVLSLEKLSSWHWETPECLYVEAGVTNTEIAEICAESDRAGASWMYRMPGQIGATVRMNARCYGGEISQCVAQVVAFNSDGELKTYSAKQIFQGYKKTLFMDEPHVVVGVRLLFPTVQTAEILIKHMHECEADRHSKKHFFLPSCGSTFKNNYALGKPSGQIFDELGLKGQQKGAAQVSEFHANFIWNCGQAKTTDMLTLAASMRSKAKQVLKADIDLEVQPVGCFSQELFDSCGMEKLGCYFSDTQDPQNKWSGLFSFPTHNSLRDNNFPKEIVSSPFCEYHQTPLRGEPFVSFHLLQLQPLAQARANPHTPFLKWETHFLKEEGEVFPLKPTCENGSYVNNLWHYSVSEIFFAHALKPECYLEYEMTPQSHWLAIKFEGVRKKVGEGMKPCEFNHLEQISKTEELESALFGMTFSYTDLEYVLDNSHSILVQGALSLGHERYLLAPYWKADTNKKENPNFHQPGKFWRYEFKD